MERRYLRVAMLATAVSQQVLVCWADDAAECTAWRPWHAGTEPPAVPVPH